MNNILKTLISEYANSPIILSLIQNFNSNVDQSADFDNLYSWVFNLNTAQGFGLDIWGRILNIPRQINVPAIYPVLVAPGPTLLTDTQYRVLLLTKALANITDCTAPSINVALKTLFAGSGNAYVQNLGNMHIRYTFMFALQAFEFGIILADNVVPRPAGVGYDIFSINPYFGFGEALSWQPFGQAVFAAY